jgi:hypothetical protein
VMRATAASIKEPMATRSMPWVWGTTRVQTREKGCHILGDNRTGYIPLTA